MQAVMLKVAAVSGSIWPMLPLHAAVQLRTPQVKYTKALNAIFTFNTTRECCLDHKMYV